MVTAVPAIKPGPIVGHNVYCPTVPTGKRPGTATGFCLLFGYSTFSFGFFTRFRFVWHMFGLLL
jgi:hypothetical protein